uniref:Uncharacterized protein n=1 Tax=Zea mays TaxID=4577 RepID=A0A804M093_MAIZE
KKAYRKATLCVHPDKVQQRGATIRQKYICEKVFDLLKNPPSVPTLAAVKLASWLRGAKFIVDWHKFGYTLSGLSHGRSHIIVKIYFWFEKYFRQMADGAFCVTKAMQHELDQNWGIRATVLYDQSASLMEKHGAREFHL